MTDWRNSKTEELFKSFLTLKTTDEVAAFCRDLMTEEEIKEFAARFQVAKSLDAGISQRETSKKTTVSIATVTRVNQWLKRGMGGYRLVLDRLHHSHPKNRVLDSTS